MDIHARDTANPILPQRPAKSAQIKFVPRRQTVLPPLHHPKDSWENCCWKSHSIPKKTSRRKQVNRHVPAGQVKKTEGQVRKPQAKAIQVQPQSGWQSGQKSQSQVWRELLP